MKKSDWVVIILLLGVIFSLALTLIKINEFMPIFHSCDDDFAVVYRCKCVPCSWQDAEEYNGESSCLTFRNGH